MSPTHEMQKYSHNKPLSLYFYFMRIFAQPFLSFSVNTSCFLFPFVSFGVNLLRYIVVEDNYKNLKKSERIVIRKDRKIKTFMSFIFIDELKRIINKYIKIILYLLLMNKEYEYLEIYENVLSEELCEEIINKFISEPNKIRASDIVISTDSPLHITSVMSFLSHIGCINLSGNTILCLIILLES